MNIVLRGTLVGTLFNLYGCLPPTLSYEDFNKQSKDAGGIEIKEDTAGQDNVSEDMNLVDIMDGGGIAEAGYDIAIQKSSEAGSGSDTVIQMNDVLKVPLPYIKDEHCVALFHFEVPNEFSDFCNGLKLNNYNTVEGESLQGFGKGRVFDGKAYLELPDTVLLKVKSGLTLEAIVKPQLSSQSYEGKYGNIITTEDFYEGYFLKVEEGKVTGGAMLSDGKIHTVSSVYILPTDTFTHLAFTYDGAKMKLYVERKLVAEELAQGTIVYKTNKSVFFGLNAYENGFKGVIDEVRISDVAREF